MEAKTCPQCKDFIEDSSKRIIKDSCGHEKCRVCLLQDVDFCLQCHENISISTISTNVPTENNHTTVIHCSKIYNTFKKESSPENIVEVQLKDVQYDLEENQDESNEVMNETINNKGIELKTNIQKRRYETITLPNHISTEGTPPTFFCNICKSKFKTKGHVKYHQFCSGENKPFKCEICNKSFILRSQLSVHELIHSGKKPYSCKICQKAFRESGKLKRHMVLHTAEKPHVCHECGKKFKTLNSVQMHRIIHTGDKPFSCKYCKMRFNNSSNLKKHILSHSDEKTHMCEQCGKKFKQKWALTVHCRSHMHRRDFVCEICEKAFINNKDLKRHETIHLGIKIFSCGICSMSFRRKDNLGRHFRNAHPDKKPEIIERKVDPPDKLKAAVVDNPNAINVITSSPITRKSEEINDKINSLPRTCMNGPLKLAFKTSAFKKNYNINRDHPYDSNSRDVVRNVEQDVIKSTSNQIPKHHNNPSGIFPSVYSSVDEYYANRPQVIKNIKFKIPSNFPPENEGILKTIMSQSQMNSEEEKNNNKKKDGVVKDNVTEERCISSIVMERNKETFADCEEIKEVTVGATSVIVNSSDQKNLHWRRKMSHNML